MKNGKNEGSKGGREKEVRNTKYLSKNFSFFELLFYEYFMSSIQSTF